MRVTVAEIVARLGGQCVGDPSLAIDRIAPLDSAGPSQISFLSHARYRAQLARTAGPEEQASFAELALTMHELLRRRSARAVRIAAESLAYPNAQ